MVIHNVSSPLFEDTMYGTYCMKYFLSYDRRAGRLDTPLAHVFFSLDGHAKLVSMLHSRQLQQVESEASSKKNAKAPLYMRSQISCLDEINQAKIC